MLSVTALFAEGTLRVTGDDQDNVIKVSSNAAGIILVNDGAIPILGGAATVANTNHFHIVGAGGNDDISLDEAHGALPGAALFGGTGNDTLTGGSGEDFVDAEAGSDTVFLGGGDDEFQWNPGDGSDVVEGQGGRDTLIFNGSDLAENFILSANGGHARFTRDIGTVALDLHGLEEIDLNALGGADTITVNDQSATGLNTFNLDLSSPASPFGDNQLDVVTINGTDSNDVGQIRSIATRINATVSAVPFVNITGSEGTDVLVVNTLGGDDALDASDLAATNASQLIKLTLNGGAGNDTLTGSQGFDTFVWNPGDGNDVIAGGDGEDTIIFNGSDETERFEASANGARIRLTRDLGTVAMDVGGVEEVDVNPVGGADTVTVNDLTGTPVTEIFLNLAGAAGGTTGDGRADSVIVNGRNAADVLPVIGHNGVIIVDGGFADGSGLPYFTVIRSVEAADALRVNGDGGNDRLDLEVQTPVMLSVDGGAQQDAINIMSTASGNAVNVRPSTGDDAITVNADALGVANVSFDTAQRIGALTIGSGGVATLTAEGGANVLTVTSLDITGTGTLNLNDNSLILDYASTSPIATVQSLLRRGYNGGAWNGDGIMTSLGNASTFAPGFAEASDVAPGGSFNGQPVDRTAVVVRFTRYGDANLDARVDFNDLLEMAQNFGSDVSAVTGGSWRHADFTYDGVADFNDLVKLAQNYNTSLPAAPALAAQQPQRRLRRAYQPRHE
jgi:hypothetical protein